jgi:hypothetical protein
MYLKEMSLHDPFKTPPKDAYLTNVENIVPIARNGALVPTWKIQPLFNN